jgi:NAD(P)-dependent dehydrogenase (short-subunit alcohol dehydrogenase family)
MPSDRPGAVPGTQELTGRAALVTGGTRRIGLAIARRFAATGARVLVCGRTAPEDLPVGLEFAQADVREPAQAADVVDTAASRLGRLDVVVNNAGGSPSVPAADASPNLITAVVRLNLLGPSSWRRQRTRSCATRRAAASS